MAQIVRVFDVVLELAFRVAGMGGLDRRHPPALRRPERAFDPAGVTSVRSFEHAEFGGIGAGGEQRPRRTSGPRARWTRTRGRRRGCRTVTRSMHAGALAELAWRSRRCAAGSSGSSITILLKPCSMASSISASDLLLPCSTRRRPGNARGERDAHLTHGAGVHEHAGFGDDAADFLAQQRFAGEADVGERMLLNAWDGGAHEVRGAGDARHRCR